MKRSILTSWGGDISFLRGRQEAKNTAQRLKEGDEVQFVVFDVPVHPPDVKKGQQIGKRIRSTHTGG